MYFCQLVVCQSKEIIFYKSYSPFIWHIIWSLSLGITPGVIQGNICGNRYQTLVSLWKTQFLVFIKQYLPKAFPQEIHSKFQWEMPSKIINLKCIFVGLNKKLAIINILMIYTCLLQLCRIKNKANKMKMNRWLI